MNLKFYLTNWANDRADVEYLLDSNSFDQTFSVLPWSNLPIESYSFNLGSRSFGEESSNSIQNSRLFPFDSTMATSISIVIDDTVVSNKQNASSANQQYVKNTNQFGTGLHSVDMQLNDQTEPLLLVLSQSYDPAWLAFARPGNVSWWWLASYLRLPHHRYIGWANAWGMPGCAEKSDSLVREASRDSIDESDESTSTNCHYHVIIFYWPQLLSLVGYVLLFASSGWLLYQVWRSRSGDTRSWSHSDHQSASHPKRQRLAIDTKKRLAP